MVDDVQSFVAAAEVLKERGAYKIYVLATHGLLSSDAPRLIEDSPIDEASFFFFCFLLYYYKILRHS
jgi:phosphoribosylpyrophosphate synthetase